MHIFRTNVLKDIAIPVLISKIRAYFCLKISFHQFDHFINSIVLAEDWKLSIYSLASFEFGCIDVNELDVHEGAYTFFSKPS